MQYIQKKVYSVGSLVDTDCFLGHFWLGNTLYLSFLLTEGRTCVLIL